MGNLAHSILDRLLNLTRQNGWNFTEVLVRYALERLIARVGKSSYSRMLILKGGTMFVVWQKGLVGRPTMDADMEFRGEGTPEGLMRVFAEIMSISMEDAIRFDLELLSAGYIREDDQYGGVRVTTGFCRKSRIEAIPLSEVLARLADKVDEYELFSAQLHV